MIYAVSDIHGCYRQYKEVLEMIGFSDVRGKVILQPQGKEFFT